MNRQQRRRAAALGPRFHAGIRPSEDIELVWSLAARAAAESKGERDPRFEQVFRAITGANRVVLTKRITALAEDLRISDLGVTINSFEKGRPFPGRTWLEWDGAVEGREEPLPHQVRYDRLGMLVEADDTGQRGRMVSVIRVAPGEGEDSGTVDMSPIAVTFDLRDAYERPESILEPASVGEIQSRLAAVQDPTPAELEGSALVTAVLSRRFGVIDNPYTAAFLHRHLGSGARRWHENHPDMLQTAIEEVMVEAVLTLCAFMVLRTVGIKATEVARGARRRAVIHGIGTVLLGYGILDVAAQNRPQFKWDGSLQSPSSEEAAQ